MNSVTKPVGLWEMDGDGMGTAWKTLTLPEALQFQWPGGTMLISGLGFKNTKNIAQRCCEML